MPDSPLPASGCALSAREVCVPGLLEARGFDVLTHSQVPCNDGAISLGQAVAAAAPTAPNNSYGPRTFI